jgi:hypothetical protein
MLRSRAEIARVAHQLRLGSVDPIEGCREILAASHLVRPEERTSSCFALLALIDDEGERFPRPPQRHLFEPGFLLVLDQQRSSFLLRVSGELNAACDELVAMMDAGPTATLGEVELDEVFEWDEGFVAGILGWNGQRYLATIVALDREAGRRDIALVAIGEPERAELLAGGRPAALKKWRCAISDNRDPLPVCTIDGAGRVAVAGRLAWTELSNVSFDDVEGAIRRGREWLASPPAFL